jgi:hypothetical protein
VPEPGSVTVTQQPRGPQSNFEKANDFKGSVTVATVTDGRANQSKTVTPFARSQWHAGGSPVTVPERHPGAAAYAGAVMLASVGIILSAVGMIETATYALAVGGVLFCALAVSADVLTLTMPSVVGALWRHRSPAVVLGGLLWCAGAAVTVANLAGYIGEHIEQYENGRQRMATGRSMALERTGAAQG